MWQRVALSAFLWLSFVRPTAVAADASLDPSWSAVQAFILLGGARCGVDTVFTFGPLGWFHNPTYVAELFGAHLVWEVVLKGLVAILVVATLARLRNGWDFALAYAAALCAGARPDGLAFVALFANAAWVGARVDRPLVASVLALAPSAALALVKFPHFVVFTAATVALAISIGATSGLRRAVCFVAGVSVLFVAAWSASGQAAANVPAWIATSFAVASGYGAALGTETSRAQFSLALLVLATCALALHLALRSNRTPGRAALVGLFALVAWLAFKNGFVRGLHKPLAIFDFLAVGVFLLPLGGLETSRAARILRRVVCAAALFGHVLVQGLGAVAPRTVVLEFVERIGRSTTFLVRPAAARAELEHDLAVKRREHALPRVRDRIGSDTIDVFGCSQGIAFLNDFTYRPRPVFHGYAAFTPELQELNRHFYEGERAPRWVLFASGALDGHLSAIEDAAAFGAVSRNYRLELEEREYLLLKRIEPEARARDVGSFVVSRTARLGERLELGHLAPAGSGPWRALTLSLDVRSTLAGSLASALVKSPPLWLETEDERGRLHTWRIAPGYVARGFVVSPLLDTPARYRGWFHGEMELAVKSVRVFALDEDRWGFDDEFQCTLRRADALAPPADPEYSTRRLAGMFRPPPSAIDTSTGFEIVALRTETDVLVVGTPASLRFDLEAGRFRLAARCGLHPRLARPGSNGAAVFEVVVRQASGTEVTVARRTLEPQNVPPSAALDADLDLAPGSTVFLRSERADPNGSEASNAYWTLVAFERAP